MKTQHTAGPWTVEADGDISGPSTERNKDGLIAAVRYLGSDTDEHTANARLIAAAPELLRELKELVEIVEHLQGCSFWEHDEKQDAEMLRTAKAAIAKAEGK